MSRYSHIVEATKAEAQRVVADAFTKHDAAKADAVQRVEAANAEAHRRVAEAFAVHDAAKADTAKQVDAASADADRRVTEAIERSERKAHRMHRVAERLRGRASA